MLIAGWIGERVAQVGVSPDAAAVLRRTGPVPCNARRKQSVRLRLERLLEDDVVLPEVPEVVRVANPVSRFCEEIREAGLAFVAVVEFRIGWTVVPLGGRERVQVGVGPSHRGLDHVVDLAEGDVRRNKQTPPHRWLGDAAKAQLELQHRGADAIRLGLIRRLRHVSFLPCRVDRSAGTVEQVADGLHADGGCGRSKQTRRIIARLPQNERKENRWSR